MHMVVGGLKAMLLLALVQTNLDLDQAEKLSNQTNVIYGQPLMLFLLYGIQIVQSRYILYCIFINAAKENLSNDNYHIKSTRYVTNKILHSPCEHY